MNTTCDLVDGSNFTQIAHSDDTTISVLRNNLWMNATDKMQYTFNGGFKGGVRDAPPSGSQLFHFHAVFKKKMANNRLAPQSWRLAPPCLGNPGSATDFVCLITFLYEDMCITLSQHMLHIDCSYIHMWIRRSGRSQRRTWCRCLQHWDIQHN